MTSLVADYSSSGSDNEDEKNEENYNRRQEENIYNEDDEDEDENYEKDSNESNNDEETLLNETKKNSTKLPRPNFETSSGLSLNVKNSVFCNPFVEAENAKKAILEKHVKMTPTKEEIKMINGKKICWSFRKGRCRFGHNCKFAHDSDLQKNDEINNDNNCINLNEHQPSTLSNNNGCIISTNTITSTTTTTTATAISINSITGSSNSSNNNSNYPNGVDDNFWDQDTIRDKKKRPGLTQGLIPGKKVLKMYKKQQVKDTPWSISSKTSV